MKSLKKLLPVLLTIIIIASCLAFASCGNNECKHKWSNWESTGVVFCDGNEQTRTCSACGEQETRTEQTGDYSLHDFLDWTNTKQMTCTEDGIQTRTCKKCPLVETKTIEKTGHTDTLICKNCALPVIEFPEFNVDDYKSYAIKFTDFSIEVSDFDDPEYNGEISMINMATAYLTLDENDELYGYGYGEVSIDADETDVENTLAVTVYFSDGYVYTYVAGSPNIDSTAAASSYSKLSLKDAAEQELEVSIEEYYDVLEELEAWINESDFSGILNIDLGKYPENVKNIVVDTLNDMFVKTTNPDGTTLYTLSFDEIHHLYEVIRDETVKSHVDAILGDGTFDDIVDFINSDEFYELSVSDALNYVEVDLDIDLEALFNDLDKLAAIIAQDDEAKFEDLLDIDEMDIYDLITNEEIADLTVMDAILDSMGVADKDRDEAAKEVKEQIAQMLDEIGKSTIIDLYFDGLDAKELEDAIKELEDELNEQLELIDGIIDFTVCLGEGNKFEYALLSVNYEETLATVKFTDKISISVEMSPDEANGIIGADIIPGEAINFDFSKIDAAIAPFKDAYKLTIEDIYSYLSDNESLYSICVINNGTVYRCYTYDCSGSTIEGDDENLNYFIDVSLYRYGDVIQLNATDYCGGGYIYNADISYSYSYHQFEVVAPKASTPIQLLELLSLDTYDFGDVTFRNNSSTSIRYTVDDGKFVPKDSSDYSVRGHNFQINEDLSIDGGDTCEAIHCDYYECSNCDASYKSYRSNDHDWEKHLYSFEDGKFTAVNQCTACEVTDDNYAWTFTVESVLDKKYYESDSFAGFTVDIDEETAGYYTIYAESENYANTCVTVYTIDEDGELAEIAYGYYGDYNGGFSLDIELDAGKTYLFATQRYDSYKISNSRDIVINLIEYQDE